MPKLPNSLRGPGGESRPSGKGERYHGVGCLFFLLTFFVGFVLSLLLSWTYLFNLASDPDPWGWSWAAIWIASIYAMIAYPIVTVVLFFGSNLIPCLRHTLTGYCISLVISTVVTPFAGHGLLYLIYIVSGS